MDDDTSPDFTSHARACASHRTASVASFRWRRPGSGARRDVVRVRGDDRLSCLTVSPQSCARSGDRVSSRILAGSIPPSDPSRSSVPAVLKVLAQSAGVNAISQEDAVARPVETVERAQVQLHEQEPPGRPPAALVGLAGQQSAALARA